MYKIHQGWGMGGGGGVLKFLGRKLGVLWAWWRQTFFFWLLVQLWQVLLPHCSECLMLCSEDFFYIENMSNWLLCRELHSMWKGEGVKWCLFHFIEKDLFSVALYIYMRALQYIIKFNILHVISTTLSPYFHGIW
jgi:hypothetical protein